MMASRLIGHDTPEGSEWSMVLDVGSNLYAIAGPVMAPTRLQAMAALVDWAGSPDALQSRERTAMRIALAYGHTGPATSATGAEIPEEVGAA